MYSNEKKSSNICEMVVAFYNLIDCLLPFFIGMVVFSRIGWYSLGEGGTLWERVVISGIGILWERVAFSGRGWFSLRNGGIF